MQVKTRIFCSGSEGFTLIEALLAITIGILIMAALFGFFWIQRGNADLQQDVAATQQDLRGLNQIFAQNIRMVGYNPQGRDRLPVAGCGVDVAPGFQGVDVNGNPTKFYDQSCVAENVSIDAAHIAFVADIDGNGQISNNDAPLEQMAYRSRPDCANGLGCLEQYSPATGWQLVAQNIDGVQFLYQLNDGTAVAKPTAAQLHGIRAVTVTILARAAFPKKGFINDTIYRPPSCPAHLAPRTPGLCADGFNGDNPWNDNFLRRMLTFTVQCRNI